MSERNDDALVTVASFTDAIAAHIARGRLAAEGIDAIVADEHVVWADWLYSNAVGGVKLRVAASEAPRARAVLQALAQGDFAAPDEDVAPRCPRCGGAIAADRRTLRVALVSLVLFQIPLPFTRNGVRCTQCAWRDRT